MDSQSNPLQPRPEYPQQPASQPGSIPVAKQPPQQMSIEDQSRIQMPQNPVTLPPALSEVAQQPLPPADTFFNSSLPQGAGFDALNPSTPQQGQGNFGTAAQPPQPPAPNAAQFFMPDAPAPGQPIVLGKKPHKKWLKPALLLLVLLILGTGTAGAYYGYYVPRQPKYILARALGNSVSDNVIKSARYQGSYAITDVSNQTYKGTFSGYADSKSFLLQGTLGLTVTTLKVEARGFANDNSYVKISGLNGLSDILKQLNLGDYAPYVDAVNDNWIELDQSLTAHAGAAGAAEVKLSDADAQKMQDLYKQHLFLQVNKVYSDEAVNGMDSYHYKISIDHNQLYAFATALNQAKISGVSEVSKNTLSWIKKTDLSKYAVGVWISKDKMIIDKVAFKGGIENSTVTTQVSLSNINSTSTVSKPKGAKTLLEILSAGFLNDPDAVEKTINQQVNNLKVLTN